MTVIPDERVAVLEAGLEPPLPPLDEHAAAGPGGEDAGPGAAETPVRATLVVVSAVLSAAAGGWLAGGLFREPMTARAIAVLGAVIGGGLVLLSTRMTRPSVAQYAVLPVAGLAGAVLIAPEATGGTANLPGLVAEALRSGGLKQPPIPFDPGWRFILVVTFAVITAAAAASALGRNRPRLASAVPLPLTFGAALLQPEGAELVGGTVATVLVVGALGVAYGATVPAAGGRSRSFETRRLLRGLVMLVVLMGAMVVLAKTQLLFPETKREFVVPPQKPPQVPLEKDREIARTSGPSRGPWRTGVLDTYDGEGWLLPGLDTGRVAEMQDGAVPGADANVPGVQEFGFRLLDMRGRSLLVPAGVVSIHGTDAALEYDPRPGVVNLDRRIPRNFEYRARGLPLPTGQQLNAAAAPDAVVAAEFGRMPPPPNKVVDVLSQAPERPFDKLQYLRDQLYANVVAAGAGSPVDISPTRVAELFESGAEATPFEITAAEAMLARWAGVPSRIGFGYYGGDQIEGGFSLRPKHGAAWLEVYFEGHGWVPLVGTPPRAKASLSEEDTNENAMVQPTDELAATIYIPMQRRSVKQLFEVVRYWLLALTPPAVGIASLLAAYPVALKRLRTSRRRRWAAGQNPRAQVLVAYAEFRDRCYDLNLGDPRDTPLEFVARFQPDDEHAELAWLTTRLLWGDLWRDARVEDAAAAEQLAESTSRRVAQMQPATNRMLGAISRVSLRDPFSDQIPNAWPRLKADGRATAVFGWLRRAGRTVRHPRLAHVTKPAVLLLVVVMTFTGCVTQGGLTGAKAKTEYPERIAPEPPETLLGLRFEQRPEAVAEYERAGTDALVTDGRFYTIHRGDVIEGSLQVSRFRPELDASEADVQSQVLAGMGGQFAVRHVGTVKLHQRRSPEQTFYLWFPPERNVMVLFVMRNAFGRRDEVVWATIGYQRGLDTTAVARAALNEGIES